MDAENLLVRESFSIPENITGRSVLSAANDMLYTVSDSGVMVFPVGRMNQQHRLLASVRDVVARGTFCNRNVITQTITITDPGGGNTDFQLSSNTQGVTISPSSGITPAVGAGARRSHGFPEPERHPVRRPDHEVRWPPSTCRRRSACSSTIAIPISAAPSSTFPAT